VHGFRQELAQRYLDERFRQERRSERIRAIDDTLLIVGGNDADRHGGIQLAQIFSEVQTVAIRHVEVHEGHMRRVRLHCAQRIGGATGFDSLPVRITAIQGLDDSHSRQLAVIHDQQLVVHVFLPYHAKPSGRSA
jgi:hypothetical protein